MPHSLVGREIVVPGSTSNLGPGFDALGLALQIYLRVRIAGVDEGARRELQFHFLAVDPRGENYIERGFRALAERVGLGEWPGLHLEVRSGIPMNGADNLARLLMPKVAKALGQPIVIENKPGAGGNVGAELVARAAPDGYTLLYGTNGTHAINPSLYRTLNFDPARDFTPVSRMTEIAAILIVNPKVPATSTAELIRYARANPGKLNFASAGNGTTSHLAGELFKTQAGLDIVHIPYRGGALALTDVIGGQAEMMIEVMPNAYPQAREGRVRASRYRRRSVAPAHQTSRRSPSPACRASRRARGTASSCRQVRRPRSCSG